MFGMGTGDPSQYGHRQNQALSGREELCSAALSLSPSAYYAKGLWLAFDLWMALGGWFPAAGRNVWFVPDGFSRAEQECDQAIWRQRTYELA